MTRSAAVKRMARQTVSRAGSPIFRLRTRPLSCMI
jgi:hypothetical protein